jgi:hypothetical protein
MTTVMCLSCGAWRDPASAHLCGALGDDTARALETPTNHKRTMREWRARQTNP